MNYSKRIIHELFMNYSLFLTIFNELVNLGLLCVHEHTVSNLMCQKLHIVSKFNMRYDVSFLMLGLLHNLMIVKETRFVCYKIINNAVIAKK